MHSVQGHNFTINLWTMKITKNTYKKSSHILYSLTKSGHLVSMFSGWLMFFMWTMQIILIIILSKSLAAVLKARKLVFLLK